MNILFNCLSSVSGGGRTYISSLSSELAKVFAAKGEHKLIFLAHRNQAQLLRGVSESNIIWISVKRLSGFRRILWERYNLQHIVTEHQFGVIFSPYQVAPQIANVKNVLMIRNMEPFYFRKYKYSISTWLRNNILATISEKYLSKADRIIAVSQFSADYLSQMNVSNERIYKIYHGSPSFHHVHSDVSDRLEGLGIGSDFIFTCGSMLPYRRCEDVIRAFNLSLPVLTKSVFLVIAGSGSDVGYARKISELIARSPQPSRILILGNVPWDTMASLYRQCKLFVMASEIEACPNIALEAMAAGCSIISSNRPPLPEIFNGCGLSYQAREIDNLSQQILRVLRNEKLQVKLKKRAFLRAQDFSWTKCALETYSALTHW